MQNVRLDELQAGIKIAGRNINNLRYTDDTTVMAESKEELKNLLMRVKDESAVTDFIFMASKVSVDYDCSHGIKRHLVFGRKAMENLESILKGRDITLSTKFCLVRAMVFPFD